MRAWKQTSKISLLYIVVGLLMPAVGFAAQAASPTYQVNEVFFGSGGELRSCSTSFCTKQSAGESVVGKAGSANFQAQGGFNTERTPYIEFTVGTTNLDLGTLTPTSTKVATANFSVKSYLAKTK